MEAAIRLLSPATVERIAAGEAIDRPASVVKELVENALDAGASRVEVELQNAGLSLIRVRDDGRGMHPADLQMATLRHATSKLQSFEDLERLRTLGFRGEALASIAAVATLGIESKTRDVEEGRRWEPRSDRPGTLSASGCPVGTCVEVHDLFGQTPARLKFLRSHLREAALVREVCQRIALANPSLHLVLRHNGRRVQEHLRVESFEMRARSIFPEEELVHARDEGPGLCIDAYLAPLARSRTTARGLFLFVNGRPVQDRALLRSVCLAYGDALGGGRYPLGVVHLEIDPAAVDVNVHPQKAEIRFRDPREVNERLMRTLAPVLRQSSERTRATAAKAEDADASSSHLPVTPDPRFASAFPRSPVATPSGVREEFLPYGRLDEARPTSSQTARGLYLIGRSLEGWLVCEKREALYLLDAHACAVALRVASLRRPETMATRTRLWFPERVELPPAIADLRPYAEALSALGFEWSEMGGRSIALRSAPGGLGGNAASFVRKWLERLRQARPESPSAQLEEALAELACHLETEDPAPEEALRSWLEQVDVDRLDAIPSCEHGPLLRARIPFSAKARSGRS